VEGVKTEERTLKRFESERWFETFLLRKTALNFNYNTANINHVRSNTRKTLFTLKVIIIDEDDSKI